jgi:hypothetical protein
LKPAARKYIANGKKSEDRRSRIENRDLLSSILYPQFLQTRAAIDSSAG